MDVETNRVADRGCASVKDPGGNRWEPVAYRRQATARVHFVVPKIQEKTVELIKVILREQCQRVRFFFRFFF